MLIGSSFNKKLEFIISTAHEQLEKSESERLSVEELNKILSFDKIELKNYLEYLRDKDFISLPTIGGPYLYGHIELTSKGEKKALELNSKK